MRALGRTRGPSCQVAPAIWSRGYVCSRGGAPGWLGWLSVQVLHSGCDFTGRDLTVVGSGPVSASPNCQDSSSGRSFQRARRTQSPGGRRRSQQDRPVPQDIRCHCPEKVRGRPPPRTVDPPRDHTPRAGALRPPSRLGATPGRPSRGPGNRKFSRLLCLPGACRSDSLHCLSVINTVGASVGRALQRGARGHLYGDDMGTATWRNEAGECSLGPGLPCRGPAAGL